ncbi:MAG: DNA translocase FtsK [Bacteroidales bacterium]|jgi:S-DNA-T family DNA segregation ATPase FtsK/SpoIIIE|nr:DNA translocase FtsK [Bacteroidales bacterium]
MAKQTKKTVAVDDTVAENVSMQTLKSEKFRFASGVFFLAFALFALFAFASYLFSWWVDFDQISHISTADLITDSSTKIRNIAGRMGAYVADVFIRNGFGLSSFLFILIAVGIGLKLLNIPFLKIRRLVVHAVFFVVWASVILGFATLALGQWSILGGIFGYEIANYLNAAIGTPGTLILLAGVLFIFVFLAYGWNVIKVLAKLKYKLFPDKPETVESLETDDNVTESEFETETQLPMETEDIPFSLMQAIENAEVSADLPQDDEVPFIVEDTIEATSKLHRSYTEAEDRENEDEIANEAIGQHGIETPYDPYLDLPNYKFPTLNLLEDYGMGNVDTSKQSTELMANKKLIENTLKSFGVDIAQIKATIGPTVTLYEIVPASGVRISKIQNLENDIALSLAALGIRIIAPMPGKGTIGIEVPNMSKQIVPMKVMLDSANFRDTKFDLPIALGKTIQNECYVADLAKMPHLLMAGATGQGKSVGLNAIIASLLYKKHPADLKFVMVDPKKVELTLYNKIERHYLAKLPNVEDAIITDTKKVVNTLNSLCVEMDARYNLLKDAQVKGIKDYNAKFISRRLNPNDGHRYLPYIVLVVDEFADLIMTAGKEVELPIARLAQLARAIGIHLIIATQRPSVNIITGTIKANFPARIAFRVTSKIDSRTILDSGGADQLIGKGDMLLSTGNELIRIQCALIDTPEIERVADFIGEQRGYPAAYELPECADESNNSGGGVFSADDRDAMFADAAQLIVSAQSGSTSLIQRKLKLGYARSGRLMDELEDAGIVGPSQGSKPREVNVKTLQELDNLLNQL